MKRKYVGEVNKRFTVYKHVSQWDGNFRCEVWELLFQSDDKAKAVDFYLQQVGGYYQLNDESLTSAKCLSATV